MSVVARAKGVRMFKVLGSSHRLEYIHDPEKHWYSFRLLPVLSESVRNDALSMCSSGSDIPPSEHTFFEHSLEYLVEFMDGYREELVKQFNDATGGKWSFDYRRELHIRTEAELEIILKAATACIDKDRRNVLLTRLFTEILVTEDVIARSYNTSGIIRGLTKDFLHARRNEELSDAAKESIDVILGCAFEKANPSRQPHSGHHAHVVHPSQLVHPAHVDHPGQLAHGAHSAHSGHDGQHVHRHEEN